MPTSEQPILLEIPEQPEPKARPRHGELKLKYVNRQQTMLAHICVEELIPADHKARAIWELAERVDLSRFTEGLRTTIGCPGQPGLDAQLLVSLWVYAYSEGISSAREIERLLPWEPGMMWLSGLETICAHKLSDFRVDHKEALDELFAELLAMLEGLGLVSLEQVAHDGTKIRAQAGMDSFRREKTLRERLAEAREVVKQMGDPQAEAPVKSRQQGQAWSMAPSAGVFGIGCACIRHLHQAALLFDGGAGWPVPAFMVGSAGGAGWPPEALAPLMPGGPTGPGGASG